MSIWKVVLCLLLFAPRFSFLFFYFFFGKNLPPQSLVAQLHTERPPPHCSGLILKEAFPWPLGPVVLSSSVRLSFYLINTPPLRRSPLFSPPHNKPAVTSSPSLPVPRFQVLAMGLTAPHITAPLLCCSASWDMMSSSPSGLQTLHSPRQHPMLRNAMHLSAPP